ncbi:hypothetical protein MIND_00136900 [Mycena indigotica]|uniref:Fungal-type protein kinase domain-containing protein n=1 Tax=Mycena indigotica TaxID=2126181 RepID=A0A8H6WFW4_9AGAR|nr:uncharacterized protein MIND_00136900 [Mycena indigotica]KAF7316187.1 hypothetical protein MIND_00136900 [Mycena indigotica]
MTILSMPWTSSACQAQADAARRKSLDSSRTCRLLFPQTKCTPRLEAVMDSSQIVERRMKQSTPYHVEDGLCLRGHTEGSLALNDTWVKGDPDGKSIEMKPKDVCRDSFDCPRHCYSISPADGDDVYNTNHLYLPASEQNRDEFHWNISKPKPQPAYRGISLRLPEIQGRSLVLCETPSSLFTSIRHAMLGWLSMFQKGFLHRDPSINNMLALETAVEIPPFEINHTLLAHGSSMKDIEFPADLRREDHDYRAQAERVEKLIRILDVGTQATGILIGIDDDEAAKWFESNAPQKASRSGTIEFISAQLTDAITFKRTHLRSPVDDLYACFFVAQWAAVHHNSTGIFIGDLRTQFNTHREIATGTIKDLCYRPGSQDFEDYGGFLCKCGPLFLSWDDKISNMRRSYKYALRYISDNEEPLKSLFITYAFRGVADYMEVLAEWKESQSA